MHVLRRLEAEGARKPLLELGVRAVVGTADDVRDLEVVIVDDTRQVRRRAAVRAEERRSPEADGAVRVGLPHHGGGFAMPFGPLALPNGAVVPGDTDPLQVGEDLLDGAVDLACAVGVVDPKQEPVTTAPVCNRRKGAAEME